MSCSITKATLLHGHPLSHQTRAPAERFCGARGSPPPGLPTSPTPGGLGRGPLHLTCLDTHYNEERQLKGVSRCSIRVASLSFVLVTLCA